MQVVFSGLKTERDSEGGKKEKRKVNEPGLCTSDAHEGDQSPRPASLPSRTHFFFFLLPIIPPGAFI